MSDSEPEYHYSDDEYAYSDEDNLAGTSAKAPKDVKTNAYSAILAGYDSALAAEKAAKHAVQLSKAKAVASSSSAADYTLLEPDEIEAEQRKIITEVAEMLDIPKECANTLLIYFKWNRERLFDSYTADPIKVREKAGIKHLGVSAPPGGPFMCEICYSDKAGKDGFGLGCRHVFCRDCWSNFFYAAVADTGSDCILSKCPYPGCTEAVTMSVVNAMASKDVAEKWKRYELQQFVNISKNMAWCPNPGCSNAFVAKAPIKTAVCTCGYKFCFRCSKEAHEPVVCDQLELWLQKCGNESETANWILANTKKCPICGIRIEKNQGCNHMQCKNKGCKHEFCWVCLGPWADHGQSTGGYYKCNKFKEIKVAEGADKAKAELDKYLFYYQRYGNHDQAGKFAAKHREAASKRMAELQAAGGLTYSDVTFLNDATEALLECRRVLKYTYVFGYYMSDTPEKRLFEHLQEQLERSTEHLAELTEKPVDKLDRGEVVNFTRVTMQFLRNLLSGIEDGLTAS